MELLNPTKTYVCTHSLIYSWQYHVLFCPKYRQAVLVGEVEQRLKELLLESKERYHYEMLEMEVMPDHVHLLMSANPQIGIHPVISRIKGYTAHVLRREFPALKRRLPSLWTCSKFIATVGSVMLDVVKRYIENQKGREEKMLLRRAFKYRLEPTDEQRQKLAQQAGCVRFVYNKALAEQRHRLTHQEKLLNYSQLSKELTGWKNDEATMWLKEVHSQPLQQTLKALGQALQDGLSGKKGMPRFKKRGVRERFRFPQGVKLFDQFVYLPKVGWVEFRKSRDVEGTIKNATVSYHCGHWYVSIQTEQEVELPVHPSQTGVGIDMGIKHFATLSNGEFFEPLHSFRKAEARLAREQRKLSRKVKGSNNWYKQKRKVQRVHKRIADIRQDYLHKRSYAISKNHAMVVMEALKVSNMSRSAKGTLENPGRHVKQKSGLNKAILDQGWGEFRRQLEYKMQWRGGEVRFVPPQYTSQTCPVCGCVERANRPSQEKFCCVECGHSGHADEIAAQNIWYRGSRGNHPERENACGEVVVGPSRKQESQAL